MSNNIGNKITIKDVYAIGDTHGTHDIEKVRKLKISDNDIKENEKNLFIQLGDFGAIWDNDLFGNYEVLEEWHNLLNKNNAEIFVVLGNHENYDLIETFDEIDLSTKFNDVFGFAKVLPTEFNNEKRSFYFLKDGEITIKDKKCLIVRGALSIDKNRRVKGLSYWEQELLSEEEKNRIFALANGKEYNYVFTHTCPVSIMEILFEYADILYRDKFLDPMSVFFEDLSRVIKFQKWYFGHLHLDNSIQFKDRYYACLYDVIHKLEDF